MPGSHPRSTAPSWKSSLTDAKKALAQDAAELAVVLETEAEHLGDGHDILTNGQIAQNVPIDVFGKQQGALLVA
jgi:hypothetical protein